MVICVPVAEKYSKLYEVGVREKAVQGTDGGWKGRYKLLVHEPGEVTEFTLYACGVARERTESE